MSTLSGANLWLRFAPRLFVATALLTVGLSLAMLLLDPSANWLNVLGAMSMLAACGGVLYRCLRAVQQSPVYKPWSCARCGQVLLRLNAACCPACGQPIRAGEA
jgi:hypothetical protein